MVKKKIPIDNYEEETLEGPIMVADSDKNIYAIRSYSVGGVLFKINKSGKVVWKHKFKTDGFKYCFPCSIKESNNKITICFGSGEKAVVGTDTGEEVMD